MLQPGMPKEGLLGCTKNRGDPELRIAHEVVRVIPRSGQRQLTILGCLDGGRRVGHSSSAVGVGTPPPSPTMRVQTTPFERRRTRAQRAGLLHDIIVIGLLRQRY